MDLPTHGLMAAALAAGAFSSSPVLGMCFVCGSLAPDLDLLLRTRGAVTFLRRHQTLTHSLPCIALVGTLPALGAWVFAPSMLAYAPVFALGMLFHSALDATNTFGLQAFAPLSHKRYAFEWLFCVDLFVTLTTLVALYCARYWLAARPALVSLAYAGVMLAYWGLRAALRRSAWSRAPVGTVSLIPTSIWPWLYLGCSRHGDVVRTFELDLFRGVRHAHDCEVLDHRYAATLDNLAEFQAMRALSPLYHAVEEERRGQLVRVKCKDLRIRNLRTRFGELLVDIDASGAARVVGFRV